MVAAIVLFIKMSHSRIAIDLCCGAGGLSLGFEQAGFQVIAAVDNDPINVQTHTENFPDCHTLLGSLGDITAKDLRDEAYLGDEDIDVVVGGPPCQGFSLIGKRDPNDTRNEVLFDFVRLALEIKPKYIVIENVIGLIRGEAANFAERLLLLLRTKSYVCPGAWSLNASNFGVPQNRNRVFFVAAREGFTVPEPPKPDKEYLAPTVWDAISDLVGLGSARIGSTGLYRGELGPATEYSANLRNSENVPLTACHKPRHGPKVRARFKRTQPGTHEPISRFFRLSAQGQAHTIRAGTTVEKGSYMAARPIHPTQDRCITVREAARLHGYPDGFVFNGTRWHGFRQVGNSVPPPLAKIIAASIWSLVEVNGRS